MLFGPGVTEVTKPKTAIPTNELICSFTLVVKHLYFGLWVQKPNFALSLVAGSIEF